MQFWQIITISVAIVVAAVVGWLFYERNRTEHLRQRFGPEYDRRVAALGDRRRAESQLAHSEAKVERLKDRPLALPDSTRFLERWRFCQSRFVDDPAGAVTDADCIVADVMRARGYSADDPFDRGADICAAYPNHAAEYRVANEIVNQRSQASTEDLRKAFLCFRSLFDEMLGEAEELKRAS